MAYYPPVGFYFKLSFDDISNDIDGAFQEVSGLSASNMPLEIEKGGLNTYKHKVPTRTENEPLVLKRGLVTKDSTLLKWCEETLQSDMSKPIKLRSFRLYLLDENEKTLLLWQFKDAYPTKWSTSTFNAQENTVLIETLEIAYSFFTKVQ